MRDALVRRARLQFAHLTRHESEACDRFMLVADLGKKLHPQTDPEHRHMSACEFPTQFVRQSAFDEIAHGRRKGADAGQDNVACRRQPAGRAHEIDRRALLDDRARDRIDIAQAVVDDGDFRHRYGPLPQVTGATRIGLPVASFSSLPAASDLKIFLFVKRSQIATNSSVVIPISARISASGRPR